MDGSDTKIIPMKVRKLKTKKDRMLATTLALIEAMPVEGDDKMVATVEEEGFIYCMSDTYAPGRVKVGMTRRSINERLEEANRGDTWKLTNYVVNYHRKVDNPLEKERIVHKAMKEWRIRADREFFKLEPAAAIEIIERVLSGDTMYGIEKIEEEGGV
ncbi:MAG: hypothetical protein F2563_02200 [Actinobacteria bacterium]|nr:hypothetical protein [Actinomycetota bacterium]